MPAPTSVPVLVAVGGGGGAAELRVGVEGCDITTSSSSQYARVATGAAVGAIATAMVTAVSSSAVAEVMAMSEELAAARTAGAALFAEVVKRLEADHLLILEGRQPTSSNKPAVPLPKGIQVASSGVCWMAVRGQGPQKDKVSYFFLLPDVSGGVTSGSRRYNYAGGTPAESWKSDEGLNDEHDQKLKPPSRHGNWWCTRWCSRRGR